MVRTGLWIELVGDRRIPRRARTGLADGPAHGPGGPLIVLEIVLTPLLSRAGIPHAIDLQRGLLGVAATRLEPAGLPSVLGPMHGGDMTITESTTVAVCVIVGWVVVWTGLGAWRMVTRDA